MHFCPECNKHYKTAGSLQTHLEIHLCTPAAQFQCFYCPRILRGPMARYNHVSSAHRDSFQDYRLRYPEDPADTEMRKKVKDYYLEITGDTSNPNVSLPTADTTAESLDDSAEATKAINISTLDREASSMSDAALETPKRSTRLNQVAHKLACPSPDCGKDDFVTKHGLKKHMKFRHAGIFDESSPLGFSESSLENIGLVATPTPENADEDQAEQQVPPTTARSERKRKRQTRNNDDDAPSENLPRRNPRRNRKKANTTLTTDTLTMLQPLSDSDSPLTYTCACGMHYLDETDLTIHLQTYHTELCDRECPICFFVLKSANEYAFYVHKRAHSFDASHPFSCNHPEDCHKKFKTAGDLARHTHNLSIPELQGLEGAPQQHDFQEYEHQEMDLAGTFESAQLHETEEEPYELMAHHRVQVVFEEQPESGPSWSAVEGTHKTEVEMPPSSEQTELMETGQMDHDDEYQEHQVPLTNSDPGQSSADFVDHSETAEDNVEMEQHDEEMFDPARPIKRSPSIIWLDTISSVKCGNCLLPMEQEHRQGCPSTPPPVVDEWKLWIRG